MMFYRLFDGGPEPRPLTGYLDLELNDVEYMMYYALHLEGYEDAVLRVLQAALLDFLNYVYEPDARGFLSEDNFNREYADRYLAEHDIRDYDDPKEIDFSNLVDFSNDDEIY